MLGAALTVGEVVSTTIISLLLNKNELDAVVDIVEASCDVGIGTEMTDGEGGDIIKGMQKKKASAIYDFLIHNE